MSFLKKLVHRHKHGTIAATIPEAPPKRPQARAGASRACNPELKTQPAAIEKLPIELLVDIISYLHPIDWFALRLAGSRLILDVFRSHFSSTPFWTYIESLEKETRQRWPRGPQSALALAAIRGQIALLLEGLRYSPKVFWSHRVPGPQDGLGFWWDDDKQRYRYRATRAYSDSLITLGAEFGQEEVIKLALSMRHARFKPKDMITSNPPGKALRLAAANGHEDILRLLMKVDDSILYKSNYQEAFNWAAQRGQEGVLRLILHHSPGVRKQSDVYLSIVLAAKYGHSGTVSLLLAAKIPVNSCDAQKFTALHYAASEGFEEMIQELLDHGADPNLAQATNRVPLDLALQNGHEAAARLLLKCTKPSYKPHFETLPLSVAQGNEECVRMLLQLNAPRAGSLLDPSSKDPHRILRQLTDHVNASAVLRKGIFPVLHEAVAGSSTSMIALLLEHNEDPNSALYNGLTPLHFLSFSYPSFGCEIADQLLDAGAKINLDDSHGRTPLHFAAQRGHAEYVGHLIVRGANIEAKTPTKLTPLHLAAINLHVEATRALLDSGAEINAQDYLGMTPLHFAACADSQETYDLLVSRGADPNLTNRDGRTPEAERERTKPWEYMADRLTVSPLFYPDYIIGAYRLQKTVTSDLYPVYEKINPSFFLDK